MRFSVRIPVDTPERTLGPNVVSEAVLAVKQNAATSGLSAFSRNWETIATRESNVRKEWFLITDKSTRDERSPGDMNNGIGARLPSGTIVGLPNAVDLSSSSLDLCSEVIPTLSLSRARETVLLRISHIRALDGNVRHV